MVDLCACISAVLDRDPWLGRVATPPALKTLEGRLRNLVGDVGGFGFELSLTRDGVDLGMLVTAPRGERAAWSSSAEACNRDLHRANGWHRIERFARDWERPGSPESETIACAFLEFDTSLGDEQLEAPSLFLRVSDETQFSQRAVLRDALASNLAARMLGAPLSYRARRSLEYCIAVMPAGSILLHVGVMFSRSDEIRLHLCIPEHTTTEYLRAIGWPGSLAEVERLRKRYGEGDLLVTLQLAVGDRVGAGLGIEFSTRSSLEGGTSEWSQRLDRLVEDGLCTAAKRDALVAWPAIYARSLTPGGWPCTIRQDISHVKVTLRPDQPPQAKAYLSVVPSFQLFGPK